jgi:hypothetical protein
MATLAYVILAHEAAEQIVSLVDLLLAADPTGQVVIHYDAKSPRHQFDKLRAEFAASTRAHLVPDRIVCGWGQFSLVDAVVRALRLIRKEGLPCDHVYLLSGSCLPVRPLAQLKRFLDERPDIELIEAEPPSWVVGGLREERYQYRHWFSDQTQHRLFELSFKWQRKLGFKRRFPRGLTPRFGAQWWCLTTKTCYAILDYIDEHPSHYRFFRTTWIPDELFFQTITYKLRPSDILSKSPTFYEFSFRGKPTVFFDDSIDVVRQLPHFFARKISWLAKGLRQYLYTVAAAADDGDPLPVIGNLPPDLSYRERTARQTELPRPGQLFYGDQLAGHWPGALTSSKVSFAVLYGPPGITGLAIDVLRHAPGLSLFGRIFKPDEVDFGPSGPCFEGLRRDDIHIRAMDKPLYLSRILERAPGFPIIQISPGDDRDVEDALWHFARAVFVPCVPRQLDDEEWRKLYWALSALANPKSRMRYLDWPEVQAGNHHVLDTVINRHIEEYTERVHRDWMTKHVFKNHGDRNVIHLYFDTEGREMRSKLKNQRDHEKTLRAVLRRAGLTILPLFGALDSLQNRFSALGPETVLNLLPNLWRPYFRVLVEPLLSPQLATPLAPPQLSVIERLAANAED